MDLQKKINLLVADANDCDEQAARWKTHVVEVEREILGYKKRAYELRTEAQRLQQQLDLDDRGLIA